MKATSALKADEWQHFEPKMHDDREEAGRKQSRMKDVPTQGKGAVLSKLSAYI